MCQYPRNQLSLQSYQHYLQPSNQRAGQTTHGCNNVTCSLAEVAALVPHLKAILAAAQNVECQSLTEWNRTSLE